MSAITQDGRCVALPSLYSQETESHRCRGAGKNVADSDAHESIANLILLSLPRATLRRLQPDLELVSTARGEVVDRADQPVNYLHFVNRGLISLVKSMEDGRTVEIGVVGIEGVTQPGTIFGISRAPLDTVVQVPGSAFRIKHGIMKDCLAKDQELREALEKYERFALLAFAQTAACNRLHHLEERCCRWLLIAHDNALSDTFQLTHEFLAMMLGVQRSGVSIAASRLQKAGLIQYRRGQVTIVNRSGLEDATCECYATMRTEFRKLFGPPKSA
ncbi:Crp/Fnr family transcriptional regulator [Bradyrhizobium embrapense]|uniref:Crp/Fnr family transcriptional regulator n=1 Tax=Bradyrhizobium embrapense TaxID=630921 RepID=UPI000A040CB9|nr:Crp/Fnr family transcriptional regulator [Bradyrhizobium embrapense]